MMIEIMRELITIKKTNEITSKQLICLAKRVNVQRAQTKI